MPNVQGTTLIEVLIALILLSTVFLATAKMQWQLSKSINSSLVKVDALLALTNISESFIANSQFKVPKPLTAQIIKKKNAVKITVMWKDEGIQKVVRNLNQID
jgi:Tfp pilus assembly protein PilV